MTCHCGASLDTFADQLSQQCADCRRSLPLLDHTQRHKHFTTCPLHGCEHRPSEG